MTWADAAVPLLTLVGWGLALGALGAVTLSRRVARL
jgi:hypothetical protein